MLAIRMQRTGRKGHAMFRVVVQDSRFTPTSGRVVANVGSYDPHSKAVVINKDKIVFYLDHGAQPSDRVVKLLVSEGVKLPDWVDTPDKDKKRAIRHEDKLRRNRPAETVVKVAEKPSEPEAEPTAESSEKTAEPVKETSTEAVSEPAAPAAESEASAVSEAEKS